MSSPLVRRSKHISMILRHKPEAVGLTLDSAGWVSIADLLAATSYTRDELDATVAQNDKKRFEISADGTQIRAVQGHSVEVDLEYPPSEPPPVLYHGTAIHLVPQIVAEGLKPMARRHVHLSADIKTAMIVGTRHGEPVVFKVDAVMSFLMGNKFYLANNGVWLADAVPPHFLKLMTSND